MRNNLWNLCDYFALFYLSLDCAGRLPSQEDRQLHGKMNLAETADQHPQAVGEGATHREVRWTDSTRHDGGQSEGPGGRLQGPPLRVDDGGLGEG